MEKIDLSTNSKKIQELYTKIVRGDENTRYGVFTVDKSNILDATASGSGDLDEFVEEFTDGHVQFGLARVTVPGSDVFKNVLLGWCPDNAPAKMRLSFAPNFADVAKTFSGYHIQITARDTDDLDVKEILARVGAAAGARYTYHASGASGSLSNAKGPSKTVTPKVVHDKPSYVPKSTGKPIAPALSSEQKAFGAPKPIPKKPETLDDGWGGEKEIEERDFEKKPLEDVPSAYKPTKVNIEQLRSQKSDTISSQPKASPKPATDSSSNVEESKSLNERMKAYQNNDDGRLTSLPKPKVNHSVSSRYSPVEGSSQPAFGAKPPAPVVPKKKELPEGVFQSSANENGLTPAQAWALKRGKYKVVDKSEDEESANVVSSLSIKEDGGRVEDGIESEENSKKATEEPTIIKPQSGGFPAPPKRNIPPAPTTSSSSEEFPKIPVRGVSVLPTECSPDEVENELEDEAVDDSESPAAPDAPSLPSRTAAETPNQDASITESVSAVAQFDYEKDEDNELGFAEGDLIIEIDYVDDEWWSGKNSRTGEIGVFPGSYVTVQDADSSNGAEPGTDTPITSDIDAAPSKGSGKSAIAEYDYEKEEDNEIGFSEGDLIVEIEFVDEDWWSGKHSVTGEVGVFPGNYVTLQ